MLQIIIILAIWAIASASLAANHAFACRLGNSGLLYSAVPAGSWLERLEEVENGADLLLGELLVFFIPPVVGVIQYQE